MENKIKLLFYEKYKKDITENIVALIMHIQKQTKKLEIESKNLSPDDFIKKVNDPTYLENDSYKLTDHGLKLLIPTTELFEMIKKYINKDIQELTIPYDMISDIRYLGKFKKLEKLKIDDYSRLTLEDLDKIERYTNIKEIITRDNVMIGEDVKDSDLIGITNLGLYKYHKLIIKKQPQNKPTSIEGKINRLEDLEKIENLLHDVDLKDVKQFSIECKNEECSDINKKMIFFSINDGKIDTLNINIKNLQKLKQLLKLLELREIKANKIIVNLENKTYEGLEELVDITKRLDIKIDYGAPQLTDLEGFLSMRYTLDYYKELINSVDLSPLEKAIYAYDLIKSYQYNEKYDDLVKSRYIPEIVKEGYIVCAGYSSMLKQLMKEIDIPTENVNVIVKNGEEEYGHTRNIIKLDDNKYNVHGIYIIDATNDSRRNDLSQVIDKDGSSKIRYNKEEEDIVIKQYDGLSLYQYFLVPYEEYTSVFKNDTQPYIFRYLYSLKTKSQNNETQNYLNIFDINYMNIKYLEEQTEALFGTKYDAEEVITKIKTSKKPSLEVFRRAIETVRKAEGYQENSLQENINETIELNQMISDLAERTHFFPEESNFNKK